MRHFYQSSWTTLLLGLVALSGCGGDPGTKEPEKQGDGGAPPVTQQDGGVKPALDGSKPPGVFGTCCLNEAFYLCATKAAFELCAGFDVAACHAACGMTDFECHMTCDEKAMQATHDPSQCQRSATRDGECKSTQPPKTCQTAAGAEKCTLDSQCFFKNCTKGYCQMNSTGSLCTLDSHCMTKNCTNGCCAGNSKGSPCTLDSHCWSNNCTGGECQ